MAVPSVVELPIGTPDSDPRRPTVDEAIETLEEAAGLTRGQQIELAIVSGGNIAAALDETELSKIGSECVEDYERDKKDREPWELIAKSALESAKQTPKSTEKNYPWPKAANIRFPLLTPAVLQFWSRMLPAVIKGDEAILCKPIGQDKGMPAMGPDGQPMVKLGENVMTATTFKAAAAHAASQLKAEGQEPPPLQPEPVWERAPGSKAKRARRVGEYLNTTVFYRMQDWESDTSSLLMQLPTVGCVFRKYWYDAAAGEQRAAMIPALRVYLPKGARSEATTPRLTEEIPDVYPHEITTHIRAGRYLDVDLYGKPAEGEASKPSQGDDGCRLILEQHRLIDLDEDGFEEPYIVTVDHESAKVLRIEANYAPEDVKLNADGQVMSIERGRFYVKHGLFPDPEGGYYDLGLGHLLDQCGAVVDTAMNQLLDAGTAQTAGGGFIGSGVRLQSRGGGGVLTMEPGKWKTVDVSGSALREAIVERTLPQVSPVTFQVLDLILGVARDISGAKDVITGEASNNGQVGTTLALIEQGLQVFNATAKCIFRSLKDEYTLLFENIRKYGGEAAAQDYSNVLDDPEANFTEDFNSKDMDIRPVSDPSSVTRMQKMAKAQFLMTFVAAPGVNPQAIYKRAWEAADVEDMDELMMPPAPPPQPSPGEVASTEKDLAGAHKAHEEALSEAQNRELQKLEALATQFARGAAMGFNS
jgi:chaperonin GroES